MKLKTKGSSNHIKKFKKEVQSESSKPKVHLCFAKFLKFGTLRGGVPSMEWSPISSPYLVCPCYIKTSSNRSLPVASYGENIASDGVIQWGGTSPTWTYCFPTQNGLFLTIFHTLYASVFHNFSKTRVWTVGRGNSVVRHSHCAARYTWSAVRYSFWKFDCLIDKQCRTTHSLYRTVHSVCRTTHFSGKIWSFEQCLAWTV